MTKQKKTTVKPVPRGPKARTPPAEATPAPKHTTKIGYLNCHVANGWGFIFGSSRKLQCVYTPAASGKKISDIA